NDRPTALRLRTLSVCVCAAGAFALTSSEAQRAGQGEPPGAQPAAAATSYAPVALERPFEEVFEEMSAGKDAIMARARALLEERYDLSDRPVEGVTMSRGKPVQGGVRVRLPEGVSSW